MTCGNNDTMATLGFTALPPLSLYIHIPWCVRKCPYCDFNSHTLPDTLPEQAYIDALIRDLAQEVPAICGRIIKTIFIGGGTPSLFSAGAYAKLLAKIGSLLPLSADAEITLEANPGTLETDRFAEYRDVGINRLSIGVQSFNDTSLNALGRIHSSKQAIDAVIAAHKAGFDNINIDLMFGLPHQTEKTARQDVATAITLAPSHISYYQLTIEPNTYFYSKPPILPDEDLITDRQIADQKQLAAAGYRHYEVSAYAKKNKWCRHNMNYWQFGDYVGIGAGAHGKITAQKSIIRRAKQKNPRTYINSAGSKKAILSESNIISDDIGFEFMLGALRLMDGFASSLFCRHTSLPIAHIDKALQYAERQGLLQHDHGHISPTEHGKRHLNTLISLFLPA